MVLATTKAFHGCFHRAISLWSVSRGEFTLKWKYLNFNREHVGESILYLWVEQIREFLVEKSQSSETGEV